MNDKTADGLPDLPDAAVSRIEQAVFDEIASERPRAATATAGRSRGRRRGWLTGAGIAAAFAVGVLVTPAILNGVGGSATSSAGGGAMPATGLTDDSVGGSVVRSVPEAATGADSPSTSTEATDSARDIITTASATLRVQDIDGAADAVTALAAEYGGYVEGTEVGKSVTIDGTASPAQPDPGYGWIAIRVPSADLATVVDRLGDVGDVLSSSISKQDVTSTTIDLQARVDATTASVQRLTELMTQSGSVADLIEAEVALTDRQAQLESYQQQLASIQDQVEMSSLQVQLTRAVEPTTADPAGFGDGLLAGWNGLIVSLNALVISAGFLLPWLALAALVAVAVWLIRRARRRARLAAASRTAAADPSDDGTAD